MAHHADGRARSVRRGTFLSCAAIATLPFLLGACTSGGSKPHSQATGVATSASRAASTSMSQAPSVAPSTAAPGTAPAVGSSAPMGYRDACASEGGVCVSNDVVGSVPATLMRALRFPVLRAGQSCPATPGSEVDTPDFGGIALGTGPVRPIIADEPVNDAQRGIADLINPTSVPPWLGVKTLWFSVPTYQGPFIIRATRLDGPGVIAMGEGPTVDTLVVPPGPTLNGGQGWRTAPGGTWVMKPGCYAWQVDGLTFSYVIVVRAVLG